MKNLILILFMMLIICPLSAYSDNNENIWEDKEQTPPEVTDRKILIAYFSWGGTTQQVAATYRDETLAKIIELTPDSEHLKGFGTTNRNADVTPWLKEIGIISNQ